MARICCDHLSLYQLTVEPGTALSKSVKKGDTVRTSYGRDSDIHSVSWLIIQVLPDSDLMADMYEVAIKVSF